MTAGAKNTATEIARLLYWLFVVSSLLVGGLVVLPFYLHGIPAAGAGDLQVSDVKQYWPFGFQGPGAAVHRAAIVLAFAAPLLIPATTIWCLLNFFLSDRRRLVQLLPAAIGVAIGFAYLLNWRAILAWHLD